MLGGFCESYGIRRALVVFIFLLNAFVFAGVDSAGAEEEESPIQKNFFANTNTIIPDSFSGSVSYSIPIEVPPGRNGMQPKLALSYRSNNGNGWLGVGWNLEVGAIERNNRFGVDYAGEDFIYHTADGHHELINVSGDGYSAKVENGDFLRIRKLVAADGLPSWEMTDKKGRRYFFGQTAASRQDDPADANRIFKWCLERVEDPNQNSMAFVYAKDQGQIYLDKIDYGNGNYIKFHLENRADSAEMYQTNFMSKTAKRLKSIEIVANSNLQSAYNLEYDVDSYLPDQQYSFTGRSVLTKIQKFGKDAVFDANGNVISGSSLPPIVLEYQDGNDEVVDAPFNFSSSLPGASVATHSYIDTNDGNIIAGDWDGNGRNDLLHLHPNSNPQYSWVAMSNGDGTFNFSSSLPGASVATHSYIASTDQNTIVGDWNGDGRTDLLHLHQNANPQYSWVAMSNGDGTFNFNSSLPGASVAAHSYIDSTSSAIRVGDWNGDGKTDLLHLHPNLDPKYSWVAISNGDGTFNFSSSLPGASEATHSYRTSQSMGNYIVTGDWDGDGRDDLLHRHPDADPQHSWVALSNGDGTFSFSSSLPGLSTAPIASFDMGDWNGDGRTDLLYLHSDPSPQYSWVAISGADGTFNFNASLPGASTATQSYLDTFTSCSYSTPYPDHNTITGDWNGDGRTDLLHLHPNADPKYSWMATSNGDGTLNFESSLPGASIATHSYLSAPCSTGAQIAKNIVAGDWNGDGKTDLLHLHPNADPKYSWVAIATWEIPDLLSKIDNGLGGVTTIAYKASTAFANTQLPFPVNTVDAIKIDDGNGNISETSYTYADGFYHIGERDFRGFGYAKVTGPAGASGERSITETWFHQGNDTAVDVNDPYVAVSYLKGKPYRVRVSDGAGNVYSDVTTIYAEDADGIAPYFNPPASVDSAICDGNACGLQTLTAYIYDGYGNVTTEYQYGDINNTADDRTIARSFSPNTTDWIVGLPSGEAVYEGIGAGAKKAETTYFYDGGGDCSTPSTNQTPTQGNLTGVVRWLDGGASPETRMGYDAYGNPTCVRDTNGNTTTIAYDSTGTFPVVETNPLGHQKVTAYYGVDGVPSDKGLYGQVKSVTDPNGAAITWEYDVFGRLAEEYDSTTQALPYGSASYFYLDFGTVGQQRVVAYFAEQNESCPSGYGFNQNSGRCEAASIYTDPICTNGAYNSSTKQCQASASIVCPDPSYSYNSATGRCEKAPTCFQGSYNFASDNCTQDAILSCPGGYTDVAATGRCEKAPECPAGYIYDTSADKCMPPSTAAIAGSCSARRWWGTFAGFSGSGSPNSAIRLAEQCSTFGSFDIYIYFDHSCGIQRILEYKSNQTSNCTSWYVNFDALAKSKNSINI